jgi:aryl-alcohol dehydrogenase-like predicted oxidoreductase
MNSLRFSPTRLAYGERPFRREPGAVPPDGDIYLAAPEERAATVRAALDVGITFFHAAYEREAVSLGASLKSLGVREQVTVSTTDGDALDRCPDTEDGAAQAVRGAIARKRELLGVDVLDVFHLYDFRPDVHTPARLAGARRALDEARAAGLVRDAGATCYGAYDALAEAIESGSLSLEVVPARFNYLDQRANERLFPVCRAWGVTTLAAQSFSWLGGVPFVRFPNTWRPRNLTKNFYGFTAAQAHLHWLLGQPNVDGILISMQTAAQVAENVGATQIAKTPQGLETLFDSFVEAMTKTREGWRGLKEDELWEYRAAAETYLSRGR